MRLGSKNLRRAIVFGAGYVAGTRAGRERYTQIQGVARGAVARLSDRYGTADRASGERPRTTTRDGYDDITLGH